MGKEKSESGKTSPAHVTDASEPKVKYVEAPIPKTNPWKKVDPAVNDVITIKPKSVENDDTNSSNEETAKIIGDKDSNVESKFIKTVKSTSKPIDSQQTVEKDIKQLSNQSEKEVFSKTEKSSPVAMASSKKIILEETSISTSTGTAWQTTAETMSKLVPLKAEKVILINFDAFCYKSGDLSSMTQITNLQIYHII